MASETARSIPAPFGAIVVMGVSGCGKSTFGQGLAQRIDGPFLEGDAFHPPANIAKMSRGVPLEDADRWPWLAALGTALGAASRAHGQAVCSCSALRRAYRDRLAKAAGLPIRFVHLAGSPELLARRLAARPGHFMPPGLLASQLATLEPPRAEEEPALTLDPALPFEALLAEALAWLRTSSQAG